jgi:hypothetical protein
VKYKNGNHMANIFSALRGNKNPLTKITSININWNGTVHSLSGIEVKDKEFYIVIPFRNNTESLLEFLNTEEPPSIIISKIEVSLPFEIISVSPKLPNSISPNTLKEFRIKLKAPAYKYEGPIQFKLFSDTSNFIHLEVTKTLVNTKNGNFALNDKPKNMNVPKSGIFVMHLQMYRVLSYQDKISKITLSDPFKFVKSKPEIPFSLDVKDSYIIELQIKVPDFNYSGVMEINFE